MAEFPLDPKGHWGTLEQQEFWREALEKVGPENVRARLMQHPYGSASSFAIGMCHNMTKGFAEEWLDWHDRQKRQAEEAHRSVVAWWTKAAAIGAIAAALFTFIGAAAAIGQAIVAWLALPKPGG